MTGSEAVSALGGITWFAAALAAYRCLPVRVGEKARVSAKTLVLDEASDARPNSRSRRNDQISVFRRDSIRSNPLMKRWSSMYATIATTSGQISVNPSSVLALDTMPLKGW